MKKTRNKFETKIHNQLKRAKVQVKYESERIPYVLARHYSPDFIINTKSGKIYIECKGYFRPDHKAKMRAVKQQHPEKDVRIVFYSFRKEYAKWCERYGFKYAVGVVPKDWLE